jgi:diacylglycerol kinase
MHRGLEAETRERNWQALDIAAGAVLMASLTAVVVGALVFGNRLLHLIGWIGTAT